MLCIAFRMPDVQMTSPWGYIYTSTFLMDGGDLFDPMAKIVHPECSLQIFRILHTYGIVELS